MPAIGLRSWFPVSRRSSCSGPRGRLISEPVPPEPVWRDREALVAADSKRYAFVFTDADRVAARQAAYR